MLVISLHVRVGGCRLTVAHTLDIAQGRILCSHGTLQCAYLGVSACVCVCFCKEKTHHCCTVLTDMAFLFGSPGLLCVAAFRCSLQYAHELEIGAVVLTFDEMQDGVLCRYGNPFCVVYLSCIRSM